MGSTRVHFHLTQDTDGFPPASVETMWAKPSDRSGEYIIDNLPFFATEATIGDVGAARDEEGNLWFEKVVRRSPNSLVRVVFFDRDSVERVTKHLVAAGCSTEYLAAHSLLAVNIPERVALATVQKYLQAEAEAGSLDYEEPMLRQ
jgi:hypothetical protein